MKKVAGNTNEIELKTKNWENEGCKKHHTWTQPHKFFCAGGVVFPGDSETQNVPFMLIF